MHHLHSHQMGEVINLNMFIYSNYEFALLALSTKWIGLPTPSEVFTQTVHSLFCMRPTSLEESRSALALSISFLSLSTLLKIWGSWDVSQRPLITMQSIDPGLLPFSIWTMGTATQITNPAVGAEDGEVLQCGSD